MREVGIRTNHEEMKLLIKAMPILTHFATHRGGEAEREEGKVYWVTI